MGISLLIAILVFVFGIGMAFLISRDLKIKKRRISPGARCSFCGKGEEDVQKLIAGPEIYICNECIDLSNNLIVEEITKVPRK